MPIEAVLLDGKPCKLDICPKCGKKFEPFLRGMVGRSPYPWWDLFGLTKPRACCALICWACKKIVSYE